jgi:hypothetical protein
VPAYPGDALGADWQKNTAPNYIARRLPVIFKAGKGEGQKMHECGK